MKADQTAHDKSSPVLQRLAWGVGVLQFGLILGAFALAIGGRSAGYSGWGFRGFPSTFAFLFSVTGLVILLHHPRHTVGWVFSAFGLFASVQGILFEYGTYALVLYPGLLPGGELVAWTLNWYWMLLFILFGLLLLIFPDGHLPSPRWWVAVVTIVVGTLVPILLAALKPGALESSFAYVNNPYGVPQLGGQFVRIFDALLVVMFLPLFGLSLTGLVTRMRRSQGRERQQFKWFVFAGAMMVATFPAAASPSPPVQAIFIAAMFFLPVAMGIAILRYRLYDIDIIIRRTLVYSVITALLALVYFGGVVMLQNLFVTFTGQAQSQLVTVVTTLTIAALFFPLRNRVQVFVDQRFYRRKYDAAKTLAQFAETARDEVELETLTGKLAQVVTDLMQPERLDIHLKPISQTRWQSGANRPTYLPPIDGTQAEREQP